MITLVIQLLNIYWVFVCYFFLLAVKGLLQTLRAVSRAVNREATTPAQKSGFPQASVWGRDPDIILAVQYPNLHHGVAFRLSLCEIENW